MKNKRTIILSLLLVVALYFGYTTFFGGEEEFVEFEGMETVETSDAGEDLLIMLDQLKAVRLNGSLFTSQAYKSLRDHTMQTREEPVGRNNSFSRVGTDGAFISATPLTEIGTSTGQTQ